MMKGVRIAAIICLLLIIMSCKTMKREGAEENYRTGTDGLRLNFLQYLPPAKLYDDTNFSVTVEVANAGAERAGKTNDKIYLGGFDHSLITGISTRGVQIPELEGKTAFNPQGNFEYINFEGTVRDLSARNIDKYPFKLIATACYNYKTQASTNVCVDPDPFSTGIKERVCIPQNVALGSQGAPIAVDKIDVEASPGRTRFRLYIANAGGGEVFKEGINYLEACSPYNPKGLKFSDADYVRINRVELSGISILSSCKPLDGGYLKLVNGKASVICELKSLKSTAAYVTPIIVELEYGYRNSISKDVEIISAGE